MENKSVKMSVFSHKTERKALSLLLSIVMILSVMMTMIPAMEVKAADDYKSLKNTTTAVKFDGKEWYLIAYDDNTVTLLSKTCVATSWYNSSGSYVEYSESTVKDAVDTYYGTLSENAQKAVSGGMFLLTPAQANEITNVEVRKCAKYGNSEYNCWWLSARVDDEHAACVFGGVGVVDTTTGHRVRTLLGVRPALQLDLTKVNFDAETKEFSLKPSIAGSGTEADPFIIKSADDLTAYAENDSFKNPDSTKPTYINIADNFSINKKIYISKDTYITGTHKITFDTSGGSAGFSMSDSSNASLTIDGPTIENNFENAISGSVTGAVTLKSGTVGAVQGTSSFAMTGGNATIVMCSGSGEISNGTIGTLILYELHDLEPNVEITGGTFEGEEPFNTTLMVNGGTCTIKGGRFKKATTDKENLESYIADGYEAIEEGDYYVVQVLAAKPAATVSGVPGAISNLLYTGSAHELVTAGTAEGGEMQYALGTKDDATGEYSASIPTATEAGTYYVWYKVVGDENHTDSKPKCIEVTIAEAKKEETDTSIETEVNVSEDAPAVKVDNLDEELAAELLTDEEKEEYNQGTPVLVYLDVKTLAKADVPEIDLEALEKVTKKDDYTYGECLDFSLWKKLGDAEPTQIHDTNGKPIKLTITIPASLKAPEGYTRTFRIIRVHDGVATVMAEGTGATLEVNSDKFSSYFLVYKDTKGAATTEATTATSTTEATTATSTTEATTATSTTEATTAASATEAAAAASTSDATTATSTTEAAKTSPKTGDSMPIAVLIVLMLSAAGVLVFMDQKKKRN